MIHNLKIHPAPFQSVKAGLKKAEFRLNDRNFELGDILVLQEWEAEINSYTGDEISVFVTHIQTGYDIPNGYCVISIEILKSLQELRKLEAENQKLCKELDSLTN